MSYWIYKWKYSQYCNWILCWVCCRRRWSKSVLNKDWRRNWNCCRNSRGWQLMNQHPPVTDEEYENYCESCSKIDKSPLSREGYEIMVNEYEQNLARWTTASISPGRHTLASTKWCRYCCTMIHIRTLIEYIVLFAFGCAITYFFFAELVTILLFIFIGSWLLTWLVRIEVQFLLTSWWQLPFTNWLAYSATIAR